MIEHSFLIHAICPFVKHQQWDYYTVKIRTAQTVDVHEIENTLNSVRGVREVDCRAYAAWVRDWYRHPGFDWCLIPDVIDGDESRNTELINGWVADNRDIQSVPVWHLHESLDWLRTLIGMFPRIALGSSGEYSQPGSKNWEVRMNEAMEVLCDSDGRPKVKIHGLRMMDPTIFSRFPLASVDSCNVARNIGIDASWESFKYGTALRKSVRGVVMAQHCEDHASATVWRRSREEQYRLLFG
jgi:hypothetical protein